jgi:23S rRNA pseudouridine2605 synthase
VRVNGRIVREVGTVVQAGDRVVVRGVEIQPPTEFTYRVLHKPVGVMTTMRDPQGRRTIAHLLSRGPRIVPVGRLDYGTSGVLLLTNDGDLANRLLHPSFGVDKTYRVVIAGRLDRDDVRRIVDGIALQDVRAQPAKVRIVSAARDRSVVDLTIHEGRNRQVRRMFEALGHPVTELSRRRFGPIVLGDLPPGCLRDLSKRERRALESYRADGG